VVFEGVEEVSCQRCGLRTIEVNPRHAVGLNGAPQWDSRGEVERGVRDDWSVAVTVLVLFSTPSVMVSPSPQSKDEENEKLHELRRYARDFRRQHTTDAEQFDWDSDDGDYGLAIGRLVVT
jgi:hypothetical protein